MVTWNLKACPRCKGDTFIDRDIDGWVEHCILCGYSRDVSGPINIVGRAPRKRRQPSEEIPTSR